ncbi:hypothetical protein MPSEU_000353800 [Mayamaea pseudoterrestris]|nr:hypothetical protein MPSEU_000353800 [Mayamaea pseudoterrestris]
MKTSGNCELDSILLASSHNGVSIRQTSNQPFHSNLVVPVSFACSRAKIIVPDDTADLDSESVDHSTLLTRSNVDKFISRKEPISLLLDLPQQESSVIQDQETLSNTILDYLPKLDKTKTGTTIVGIYVDGLVILAADTRATNGRLVADKRADKIHRLTPPSANSTVAFACGAGTSADLDKVTRQCLYTVLLQQKEHESIGQEQYMMNNNKHERRWKHHASPVVFETLCQLLQDSLYEKGGTCGANLIVGGASNGKCHLRAIHPHGSMDRIDSFAALGSGGLAAMAVLENRYKRHMTRNEAITLAQRAIQAGIENDLGSGSQVDVCVIDSSGRVEQFGAMVPEEELVDVALSDGGGDSDQPVANGGVNGFGSLPFVIRSRRVIQVDPESVEDDWNQTLGL